MIEGTTTRTQTEGDGSTIVFNFSDELQEDADLLAVFRDVNGVETTLVGGGVDFTLTLIDGGVSGGSITLTSIVPELSEFVSTIIKGAPGQDLDLANAGGFPSADMEDALDRASMGVRYSNVDQESRTLRLTDGAVASQPTHAYDAKTHIISNVVDPLLDQDAATKGSVTLAINAAASTLTNLQSVVVTAFMETFLDDVDGDAGLTTLGVSAFMLPVVKSANLAAHVSGINYAAIVQNILQDTTAGAILTELGITAYAQTLLDDADSATARATLEIDSSVSHNNELANGDFQVNQQGKTFNSTVPVAGGNNDAAYFSDQWVLLSDGNDVVDIAIVDGTTDRARNAAEFEIVTANTQWGFCQFFDNETTLSLRDKAVSFSVEVEAPGDASLFRMYVMEWTSTADAPTRDVIATYNSTTTDPTLATNWAFIGSPTAISATATSTTFRRENITIPNTANNLAVMILSVDGAMSATTKVLFSEVSLVRGPLTGVFRSRSKSAEWDQCELWLAKSFPELTFAAQNAGLDGAFHAQGFQEGGTGGTMQYPWLFSHRMVKSPTITTFNPSAAASTWDAIGAGNTRAASILGTSTRGVTLYAVPAASNNGFQWAIHVLADGRF